MRTKIYPVVFLIISLSVLLHTNTANATLIVVNSPDDAIGDDNKCTIREAIRAANTNTASGINPNECPAGEDGATDTIQMGALIHILTISGAGEEAALTGDLDIVNNTAGTDLIITTFPPGNVAVIVWSTPQTDRIFHILSGANVQMDHLTLDDGGDPGAGGGIYNDGTLSMSNCELRRNKSPNEGGGIYNTAAGIVTLTNTYVQDGNAYRGGGLYNNGTMTLTGSTVRNNAATDYAGGISNQGTLTLNGGTVVTGNTATNSGGGVYSNGILNITSSKIEHNSTSGIGGGVFNRGDLVMQSSVLSWNYANGKGGAVYSEAIGNANITGSTFSNNSVDPQFQLGSAFYFEDTAAQTVNNSCILSNNLNAYYNSDITVLNFTGNWWGASDGPSGAASGSGDSVFGPIDFTGFLTAPPAACLPAELVLNGAFEHDDNADVRPDRFTFKKLSNSDVLDCTDIARNCVMKLKGNGNVKKVTQKILTSGNTGDSLTLSIDHKTASIPKSGTMSLVATFFLGTTQTEKFTLKLKSGSHDWEIKTLPIITTAAYDNITVTLQFEKETGTARFNAMSLQLNP